MDKETFKVIEGRVTSLDELLTKFRVDLGRWEIIRWKANSYEQMVKQADGTPQIVQLFQVKAELRRKVSDYGWPRPVVVDVERKKEIRLLGKQPEIVLVVPDTQHGYCGRESFHDERALSLVVEIAKEVGPSKIVLLGDHLDLPDWTDKFLISPEMRNFTQLALNALADWLGHLRSACPGAEIHYLEGNHERRLEKAIIQHLGAAYQLRRAKEDGYPVMSVPYLLNLEKLGICWHGGYPDSQYWLDESLVCEHGTVARSRSGATAQVYLGRSYSTVVGHIHRHELLYFTEFTREGPKIRFAGSPGTLARIDGFVPAHSKRNNWQQGVWVLHKEEKDWFVEAVLIKDGKANWRGKMLVAN